jgi:hypothetical protein
MDLVNLTDLVTNLSVDRGLGRLVRLGDQLEQLDQLDRLVHRLW